MSVAKQSAARIQKRSMLQSKIADWHCRAVTGQGQLYEQRMTGQWAHLQSPVGGQRTAAAGAEGLLCIGPNRQP